MAAQSAMKVQTRQTIPRATPRACKPTRHRAAMKVWMARSWRKAPQWVSDRKTYYGGETHEGDLRHSNFTNLLGKALCCAIGPCRDDPVVSPPDIEDTTNCLENIEYENRELSCRFNKPSEWQQKACQTDHVDVGRPLEQLPATLWKLLSVPSYVPLYNTSSHRRDTWKEIEHTPIQKNMTTTLMELMSDASAINCKLDECETETDGIEYLQPSLSYPRGLDM